MVGLFYRICSAVLLLGSPAVAACASEADPPRNLTLGQVCYGQAECASGLLCRALEPSSARKQCTAKCSQPGGTQYCQDVVGEHSVCYGGSCALTCYTKCPDRTICSLAGVCLAY